MLSKQNDNYLFEKQVIIPTLYFPAVIHAGRLLTPRLLESSAAILVWLEESCLDCWLFVCSAVGRARGALLLEESLGFLVPTKRAPSTVVFSRGLFTIVARVFPKLIIVSCWVSGVRLLLLLWLLLYLVQQGWDYWDFGDWDFLSRGLPAERVVVLR